MIKTVHCEGMTGLILLAFFILLGPLALLFGVDSRVDDERGWWAGAPAAREVLSHPSPAPQPAQQSMDGTHLHPVLDPSRGIIVPC